MYSSDYKNLSYSELLVTAREVESSIIISIEECKALEEATRDQASSKKLVQSMSRQNNSIKIKSCLPHRPQKPSKSLIKVICYPSRTNFQPLRATRWGCNKEKVARESYFSVVCHQHENLVLADSGLHISQIWPYLGASSDSIVECNCCGKGAVEIKCPYKHKYVCLSEASMVDRTFCLEQKNCILSLKKSHQYYYQVQAPLYICDVD